MSTLKANRYENTASANGGIDIDSSGRVLLGTSTSRSAGDVSAALQVEGTDFATSSLNLISNAGASAGNVPHISLAKSRGTADGSSTVVASGDNLGTVQFCGADGTDLNSVAASIGAAVDGTPGGNDMPGRLLLSTTADGASSPTERVRIDSSGMMNVKSGDLRVTGGEGISAHLYLVADEGDDNGDSWRIVSNQDENDFAISNNSSGSFTERFRIGSDGAVLFENSAYAYFVSTSGSQTGLTLKKGSSAADGSDFLQCRTNNNTEKCTIKPDGDLENANNNYGGISDVKLKENIVDASSQWDDIKAIQVRNYNFKAETGHQTHTQVGVIAQEIETVSAGLVSESPDRDEDGNDLGTVTKSVKYSVLYMKSVKALQEAMTRIEALEAKVAALEAA